MSKICFVISPMGPPKSPVRIRADYVLETYIKPACREAGYEAQRADQGIGRNIVKGTTTALQNAPMAIAYMGSGPDASNGGANCWNANVMIEIGYRLASRQPLIFLCDQNVDGDLPELPMNLRILNVIGLPRPDPKNPKWVDAHPQETVESLIRGFQEEEQAGRILDSMHPVAAINAASSQVRTAKNLYYTAASDVANDLFGMELGDGLDRRLVGRTMEEFLSGVERRMHPAQWRAFDRDQKNARGKLGLRATGRGEKQSTASVPIVFENHENEWFNHRAFLPIIIQDYRPDSDGYNWYNLRVLYLNVTTATKKETGEDGEEYYVCELDPTSDARLEPLKATAKPGIRIFLSYRSNNRPRVEAFYNQLLAMKPYTDPFMDVSIQNGDNWPRVLGDALNRSELCFLFWDADNPGPGQNAEVDVLQARSMSGNKYPIVPVLFRPPRRSPDLPPFITRQWVLLDDLTDGELRHTLSYYFPDRCPTNWARQAQAAE